MDYGAAVRERLPAAWRSDEVGKLVSDLENYLPEEDLAGIVDAYRFGAEAHEGQQRLTGEPYITHPLAVARILAGLHLDSSSIKAALLHDVLEDTQVTLEDIENAFGEDVALLVDGVSKLDQLHFDSAAEAQAESFRKMLLAMVKDLRVILVKLADRTHNMRTLTALSESRQRRIARETLEIYAPIANRLGIYSLKVELEELGFKYLYPFRYAVLERTRSKTTGKKRQFFRKIESKLKKNLKEAGVDARIMGREKPLYSIYQKMQRKHVHMSDIADVYGLRITVEEIDNCYQVLGLVHQLYKPMPGRFKDYIAIPRVNGYQSLHTTLFGPNGLPLEVQIRTEEMDRVADRGIAAHWQYKAVEKHTHDAEVRAREWLASLMEMQHASNSEEFLETVRVDLFPDTVYVFTPKGDILRLPKGATAVDFAYAVHTDVGNRCVAAKINSRLVPLKTNLKNGETVQIITARGAKPSPNWVNFVVTAKARNAIRAYLKNLKHDEASELGRRLLSQALRPYSLNLRKLRKTQTESLLKEFELSDINQLYQQLGLGERLAPVVAGLLAQQEQDDTGEYADRRRPLAIAGTEKLIVSYARCCFPVPGDDILGFMSIGKGIVIHRSNCLNVSEHRKQPSKWIPVDWKRSVSGEFQSEIKVRSLNRVGVLADVAARISGNRSNIDNVSVDTDEDASTQLFRLKVRDRKHLHQVMQSVQNLDDVVRVSRTRG